MKLWRSLGFAAAMAVGFAAGVLGHYALYRLGLPLKPFIYVAF